MSTAAEASSTVKSSEPITLMRRVSRADNLEYAANRLIRVQCSRCAARYSRVRPEIFTCLLCGAPVYIYK